MAANLYGIHIFQDIQVKIQNKIEKNITIRVQLLCVYFHLKLLNNIIL